jgi:hypothetical protein
VTATPNYALDDDTLGFDFNAYFTDSDVIGRSQLLDAPLHGSQQTQVAAREAQAVAGSSQAAGQAQAEAGSSQVLIATPPMDDDRRRIIRPREPLTYDQDHMRAAARALRPKRGRRV